MTAHPSRPAASPSRPWRSAAGLRCRRPRRGAPDRAARRAAVAGESARCGGHVAKYRGDGVLASFGWPQAHEDDAERAVRAGLALVDAVAGLRTLGGEALAARVGIATGLVVAGDLIGSG